jgi:hypothetical protein
MPKKVVKKSTKKVTKKVAVKKSASSKKESLLTKRYLHAETEDFYAKHPNVKPLLILFMLIATAVFIYLIKLRMALASMMY